MENKDFLDKVYNIIVKQTILDKENNLISFPWYRMRLDHLKNVFDGPNMWRDTEPHPMYYPFFNHCVEIYGLTEEETIYLWYTYKRMLIDIVDNL